jgi:fumarylacetoacetate (FAA) hydrolase
MRVCRFRYDGKVGVGRIEDASIIEVACSDLLSLIDGGYEDAGEVPLNDAQLLAPIQNPPSIRDFSGFLEHARRAMSLRNVDVPAEWFAEPRFYFSNPAAVIGPDDDVLFPEECEERDYELELAAVIGLDGQICGFTIMNDWSARDVQRREMAVGLGPAKAKDFATSFGPILATSDELGGLEVAMCARVNGEERTRASSGTMYHTWASIMDVARRNTSLRPGDIIGSGTVGGGCILEHGDGRWLQPGDIVELEVEGIGILRNRIGVKGSGHKGSARQEAGISGASG